MSEYVKVATTSDISDDEPLRVDVGDKQIALVRAEGNIYAVSNVCTHEYAELHEGFLEDCLLECPLHGSQFDVRTGEARSLPATKPLSTYDVKIEGDDVLVAVEE